MRQIPQFVDFAERIRKLAASGPTEDELKSFLLQDDGRIRVYYAPFDWINTQAKIVVVGITPGEHSMLNALIAAAAALRRGESIDEASKEGKRTGSFSNMRFAIAEMLDELGLPAALGIRRSEEMFGPRHDLLHATSCIRHPVFVWNRKNQRWMNYTGHAPKLLKSETFLFYIEHVLAEELRQLPGALVVPCGEAVSDALRHLSAKGMLNSRHCLLGFPHASGANGYRNKYFQVRKDQLKRSLAEWSVDLAVSTDSIRVLQLSAATEPETA